MISKAVASEAFGCRDVPCEVPIHESDEISAIHCEVTAAGAQDEYSQCASNGSAAFRDTQPLVPDIENGLRQPQHYAADRLEANQQSSSWPSSETVKREMTHYLKKIKNDSTQIAGKIKDGTIVIARKVKRGSLAAWEKTYDRSSPRIQQMMTSLSTSWHKYMDGRSSTEIAIIIIIALSLFLLFILFVVVIRRQHK